MNEAPLYNFVWSFTCDLFHQNSVSKTAQFLLTQVIVHCLPTLLLTISSNRLSSPSQGSIYLCIQWEWSGRRFNYFIVIHITQSTTTTPVDNKKSTFNFREYIKRIHSCRLQVEDVIVETLQKRLERTVSQFRYCLLDHHDTFQ